MEAIIGIRRKQFSKKELVIANGQLIFWLGETISFSIFQRLLPMIIFFRLVETIFQENPSFRLLETDFRANNGFRRRKNSCRSSNINEVKNPFQTFLFFYEEIFTHTQKT